MFYSAESKRKGCELNAPLMFDNVVTHQLDLLESQKKKWHKHSLVIIIHFWLIKCCATTAIGWLYLTKLTYCVKHVLRE